MSDDKVFKSVPLIDLKDLDGKTVTLYVEYKDGFVALAGYEEESDTVYLLCVENTESPKEVH